MRTALLALAIFAGAAGAAHAWMHGGGAGASAYQGPCDVLSGPCAEAYSVDQAMTVAYTGNLFQLVLASNHASTLNVGQNPVTRMTDMTTWSAFCGGVASNCLVGKIYAQIHTGGANDLDPTSVLPPAGPNCTANAYACAAVFAIDSSTGLPKILVGTGTNSDTTDPAPQYNIGGTDVAATGVNSGVADASVMMFVTSTLLNQCCGTFGKSHKYNAGDVAGTDFLLYTQHGTYTGSGGPYGCNPPGTTTNNCGFIDTEGGITVGSGGLGGQFTTLGTLDVIDIARYNSVGQTLSNSFNGDITGPGSIISGTMAPPNYIHLGGGGDLSNPSSSNWREGFLTNYNMTSGDVAAVVSLIERQFPMLTYPNPP